MNRWLRWLLVLGLFGGFGLLVCGGVVLILSGGQPVAYVQKAFVRLAVLGREAGFEQAMSRDDAPVRFTVQVGDTPQRIADNLWVAGLIADRELFVAYVRLNDLDRQLEAGTYFLNRAQTLAELAVALTDSRFSHIEFNLIPGMRLEQVAALIDSYGDYFTFSGQTFMNSVGVGAGAQLDPAWAQAIGLPPEATLEGLLFPGQYQLPPDITPEGLRDTLVGAFRQNAGTLLVSDAAAQGFTLYELVKLASIIQREALHEDEMPMIASAYRNRLRAGMKLDADPTVQYALGWRAERWWPLITVADYTGAVSPFNTYLNYGLPPAPIANFSLAALRAAVYPAESPYYYFRADCRSDGYHSFAVTYEEHLANGC